MRLTLRTMLAFMDDILEAEDAQDLGKKIDESDFAAKLMDRIRDVTRRLRLGAPNVGERGAMFDPNTVAEYLDNTLAGDRVPDFEKVCLESDVHLAEVASCHQILTMVLGEPAEVEPEGRQRMYDLPSVVAANAKSAPDTPVEAATTHGGDGAAPAKTAPPPRPSHPAVPDYLREPPKRRRFWPAAAALFLAGFLTVVVLAVLGQFEPGKPLANFLGIRGPDEVAIGSEKPSPPDSGEGEAASETTAGGLKQPEGVQPSSPKETGKEPSEKAPLPEDVTKPGPPPEKPLPETKPVPAKPGEEPGPVAPLPPGEKPQAIPKTTEPKPDTVDIAAKPGMEKPGTVGPGAEKPGIAEVESPAAKPAEPAPVPQELLGRLLSDREVLVRMDAKEAAWMRVPAQGSVSSGQELLALPTFRPIIGLSAGSTVLLAGGTQIELLPAGAQGVPGVMIVYGRVLLTTVGKAGTQLRVRAGNLAGTLTFVDPDSTAAVAVSRTHPAGIDPENQPDPVKIEVYSRSGRIGWTAAEGAPPVIVNSPGLLTVDGQLVVPPATVDKLPEWVNADVSSTLDRRASPELERAIVADRPARIGLLELLDHRQREVKWLATRCLGYLGEYQLMVAALNNADERLAWTDYIDQLQEAVLRGPAAAGHVRRTMEKQFGQEGASLYRMLLGYSDDGLKAGDAAKLVAYLEHKDLAFRVLSFWNLKGITGLGLFYQPDVPEAKRKQSVAKWQERLKSGAILRAREAVGPAKPVPEALPAAKPGSPESPPAGKAVVPEPVPAKPAPEGQVPPP